MKINQNLRPSKKKTNSVDLSQVYNAAKLISMHIKSYKIIVNKSTVPVTTGDEIEKIIGKKVKRKAVYATFHSHLNILQSIYNSKKNTLVLEDDLIPVR